MTDLTLTTTEIQELTGYKRYTHQQQQLRCHGIPFITGPKNEPIVLRQHFHQPVKALPKVAEYLSPEPNYGALDNGKTT